MGRVIENKQIQTCNLWRYFTKIVEVKNSVNFPLPSEELCERGNAKNINQKQTEFYRKDGTLHRPIGVDRGSCDNDVVCVRARQSRSFK